ILAVKILATFDEDLMTKLKDYKRELEEDVYSMSKRLIEGRLT
ncbi:MAG: hypothetical protein N2235_26350, partial [Fischerella sp.]|nr:hypothetical protein [Fischerella sp.]